MLRKNGVATHKMKHARYLTRRSTSTNRSDQKVAARGSPSIRETTGDHKGPPSRSTTPSPLLEDFSFGGLENPEKGWSLGVPQRRYTQEEA
jgi:hypothetical protein